MTFTIDGYTMNRDFANPLFPRGHGGGCCGIRHISGFAPTYNVYVHSPRRNEPARRNLTVPFSVDLLKDAVAKTIQHRSQGILIEVVLTNAQLRELNYADALQEVGFKLVSRFQNPNSRNICNVFHYNKAPRSTTTRLPFKIKKEQA